MITSDGTSADGIARETRRPRLRDVAADKVATSDTSTLEDLSALAKLQAGDEG